MIPFAVAFRHCIMQDGTMNPPVVLQVPSDSAWMLDDDGLILTLHQCLNDGRAFMLCILFPMPTQLARAKWMQRQFPANAGDLVKVLRKHDHDKDHGGEDCVRFIAEVMTCEDANW